MKKHEYLNYCLGEGLPLVNSWVKRCFMKILDKNKNEFMFIQENDIFVFIDGEEVKIDDAKAGKPLFDVNDTFTLDAGVIKCSPKEQKTTIGIAIANMVLLDFGLNGKIPYINGEVRMGDIEDIILPLLLDNPDNEEHKKDDAFYVDDIDNLSRADMVIQEWAHFFTISRSKQSVLTPPGLEAFKKKRLKELKEKYGEDLWSEEIHAVEYIDSVKAFYKEYLKDDPTLGIVLSNKILGQSLMKRKVAFGYEKNSFNKDTPDKMILTSLSDGMDLSDEAFPYYVNSSRAGSYFRGVETQQSGTIAKNLVLATMSLKYVPGDCGSKETLEVEIKRGKRYNSRYLIENGKLVQMIDGTKWDGKVVKLRDPMYCKAPAGTFCNICVGDNSFRNPNAVVLQSTRFGGGLVNADMKKMHGSETKTVLIEF